MQTPILRLLRSSGMAIFVCCNVLGVARTVFAQVASIEYRVAFNGALGAPTVVADNGPGDSNPAPGNVTAAIPAATNGVMTLAAGGTISGAKIPGVNGRNIVVTGISGSVNAGQFPAVAGTIDIFACYKFNGPGLTIPAPNIFTRHVDGSFVNGVDNSIDLAGVRYNAQSNGACALGPGDPGAFIQAVGPNVTPPVAFFDTQTFPASGTPCVDITTVTRLTVFRNGDGVVLPGSATASVVATNTTIYSIQQGNFALNDSVLVDSVVVTGVDGKPTTYGVYIQEIPGGPYSGILAFANTAFPAYTPPSTTPAVGDLVTVRGMYSEFSGLSEIINPTFTKLGTHSLLQPTKLPIDSLKVNYPGSERWEGVLVRVDSVTVTSVNTFNDWRIHHFSGPVAGRVDSLVGYEKMISGQVVPAVGDRLNVVGVADFAFSERRIAPRGNADITFLGLPPPAEPNLAYSPAENKIKVRFNVALNAADAQTVSKYSLSTLQPIVTAVYDDPTQTVTLTVGSPLVPNVVPHVLSMAGIRNSLGVPMNDPQTISFIGGVASIPFVQTPKAGSDSSQVANRQVSIRGVVVETTSSSPTADFPAGTGGFYMQQRGTTEYGGIFVFGPPLMPVRGDSVFVSGVVQEFGVGPETEIVSVDEVTVVGTNRPAITPPVVALANASGSTPAVAEKYEGMLIKIAGVRTLTQAGPGDPFDISQALTGGTDTLRVDDLAVVESAYTPWHGDIVDVTGIVRFSGTAPFRRLQPRNWNEPPTGDIHVVAKALVSGAPPEANRTELFQNHPNPFNPTTDIAFSLAEPGDVTLRVYTVDGRLVRTLFAGKAPAGTTRCFWNGLNSHGKAVPAGVYLYRLVTAKQELTRKMVLLK